MEHFLEIICLAVFSGLMAAEIVSFFRGKKEESEILNGTIWMDKTGCVWKKGVDGIWHEQTQSSSSRRLD